MKKLVFKVLLGLVGKLIMKRLSKRSYKHANSSAYGYPKRKSKLKKLLDLFD
jgi:hypothetical protein